MDREEEAHLPLDLLELPDHLLEEVHVPGAAIASGEVTSVAVDDEVGA